MTAEAYPKAWRQAMSPAGAVEVGTEASGLFTELSDVPGKPSLRLMERRR